MLRSSVRLVRGALARLRPARPSVRVIVLSTLLTAGVVCAAFLGLSISIKARTTRFFSHELSRNQQTLLSVQGQNQDQLLLTSTLITESPTLRAAIETYRVESSEGGAQTTQLLTTIREEALKIVANLKKDLLLVTDERGIVLAAGGERGRYRAVGDDLASIAAVKRSLDPLTPLDTPNFAVVKFDGQAFHVGCVPIVLRGFVIGTVILGEAVDSAFVQGLRQSFDGEIVVATERTVIASTLRPEWIAPFASALAKSAGEPLTNARSVRLGGDEFVVAPMSLGVDEAGKPVALYLLRSLPQAMTQLNRALFLKFLLYGALTVVLVGVIAGAVSSKLTRANEILTQQMQERERVERELRASEDKLRQSQKLESIGTLAGGIAHDFNNLLTVILSCTEMSLSEAACTGSLRSDLEEVKRAGKRAADLTRQILAFSRRQILAPKVIDLNGVVFGVQQMLRRLIGENIELRTAQRALQACVLADPGQLEQVIVNLAVNARDAMPEGGALTIETAKVQLTDGDVSRLAPMPPGPWVRLSVTDSGIGMDEATQSRVFEPFFTTKARGEGTGLGLSTVYGIVKQSGGFIWVSSAPARGTTVTIYLPPAQAAAEGPCEPASDLRTAPRGQETILVVEDEDAVRGIVVRTLERSGYAVLQAGNGSEALQRARQHDGLIDLILTDVVMPRMSGTELVRRLAPTHPSTRVLYMSGYTDDLLVKHGALEPGTSLLLKPFTPAALAHKVRAVLSEQREAPEHAYATVR